MSHAPNRRTDRRQRRRCGLLARAGRLAIVVLVFSMLLHGCGCTGRSATPAAAPAPELAAERRVAPRSQPTPVRAVWVARFHYRAPDDIRAIMRNCADAGFNTVLWQVRGEATVAYPSRIEPWAKEYGFRDPGFDPLAVAVREAHANGLRIEAWVNVMPAWYGRQPPPVREHVWHRRPDWLLHDERGQPQPLNDHYVILNPCLPEVQDYILSVFDEIVSRYAVDGLHLDYVRYAWDTTPRAMQRYPRDARTLALYRQQTGRNPDDDPAAWNQWRANQLTRLVERTRDLVDQRRPGATLTAATWGDPRTGYDRYLQNAVGWLRAGLLDAAYPMAYRAAEPEFARDISSYRDLAPLARIVPGLGAYLHAQPDTLRAQLDRCRALGGDMAIFSYESLYPTVADRPGPKATPPAVRQARLAEVRRVSE